MQHNLLDYWVKRQRGASDWVMRLGRLGVRSSERFTQHQLDAARLVLEGNRRQVRQLVQADGPWMLLSEQPQLLVDIGMQVLQHGLETLEILSDTRDALSGWFKEEITALRAVPPSQALLPISASALTSTSSRCLR